jgi:hypothetical protein
MSYRAGTFPPLEDEPHDGSSDSSFSSPTGFQRAIGEDFGAMEMTSLDWQSTYQPVDAPFSALNVYNNGNASEQFHYWNLQEQPLIQMSNGDPFGIKSTDVRFPPSSSFLLLTVPY